MGYRMHGHRRGSKGRSVCVRVGCLHHRGSAMQRDTGNTLVVEQLQGEQQPGGTAGHPSNSVRNRGWAWVS